ncbi:hypothetical protein EVAR_35464_1 [Eumeta japonica]|uniref:Uncharacterized protein n=1 Tax=Eumeta variegata TaxID=151549 RepID=A0A4C1XLX9_EUMVA|nr:hypothetical protein EVAR_35464_1 [Eumeta japonica]
MSAFCKSGGSEVKRPKLRNRCVIQCSVRTNHRPTREYVNTMLSRNGRRRGKRRPARRPRPMFSCRFQRKIVVSMVVQLDGSTRDQARASGETEKIGPFQVTFIRESATSPLQVRYIKEWFVQSVGALKVTG